MSNFNKKYNIDINNMSNILFRSDSSSEIGLGHVMRDLVLAKEFGSANITFASQNLPGNINNKILKKNYKLEILQSNNAEELLRIISKLEIDLLVIDNYQISYKEEKYIKEKTEVKIFVLDDTYEKHHCDILLNHNLGADKNKYETLVPEYCKLRCGEKYTLLRKEFYKEKKKKRKIYTKYTHVFLAIGGADTTNINPKILKVLRNFENVKVNVVTSSSNKNLKKLQKYIETLKNIKLHIDSKKIAKLMRKSDLAIISPSVIANEVHFMQLPFIAIKTAANQKELYRYLKKNNFNVLKRFIAKKLRKKIKLALQKNV